MDDAVRKKRWLRRVGLAVGAFVLLGVLASGVAFAFLQTGMGRAQLAGTLSRVFTKQLARDFTIEGLSGFVPFAMRVERITLGDDTGAWLVAEDLNLGLRAAALLGRQVHLHTLSVERVQVLRKPVREDAPARSWEVPPLPQLPGWLTVSDARVGALSLDEAVLGQAAMFAVKGEYLPRQLAGGWEVNAEALRTDRDGTTATLRIAQTGDRLEVRVDVQDATMIPELADVPAPVVFRIDAAGPLENWRAEIEAASGDLPLLSGAARLEGRTPAALTASVTAQLDHPLLPRAVHEAVGPTALLEMDGTLSAEGRLTLRSARMETPRAQISAAGAVDFGGDALNLNVSASHEDLRQFVDAGHLDAAAPIAVQGHLEGQFRELKVSFETMARQQPLFSGTWALNLEAGAAIAGSYTLSPPAFLLPPAAAALAEMPLTGTLDLHLNPDRRVEVRQFDASSGDWIQVRAAGTVALQTHASDLNATLVLKDAAPLGALLDQPMDGALEATLHLAGTSESTRVTLGIASADLAYQAYRLTDLELEAAAESGLPLTRMRENVQLTARGSGTVGHEPLEVTRTFSLTLAGHGAGEEIVLDALDVQDGNLTLAASGTFQAAQRAVMVDAHLDVARVEEYARLLDQDFGGALTMTATARTGADRIIAGKVEGVWTQPRGLPENVQAIVGDRLDVDMGFTLAESVITLQHARVGVAALSAEATGTVHLGDKRLELETQAQVADLARLQPGQAQVSGQLNAAATVSGAFTDFAARGSATAQDFALPQMRMDTGTFAFAFTGLPSAPQGRIDGHATVAGERLELAATVQSALPEVRLETFRVQTRGNSVSGAVIANVEARTATGHLQAELIDLSVLGNFLNRELSGSATAKAELGTHADGMTLALEARTEKLVTPWLEAASLAVAGALEGLPGTASGNLTLSGADVARGNMRLDRLDAQWNGSLARSEISADARGELRDGLGFEASVGATASLEDRQITVHQLAGNLEGEPFQLEQPARLSALDGEFSVAPFQMSAGGGSVELAANLGREMVQANARWSGVPLSFVALFGGPEFEGAAEGQLSVQGAASAPELTLESRLMGVRSALAPSDAPSADLSATVTIRNQTLRADATLNLKEAGTLTLDASFPVVFATAPFQAELPRNARLLGAVQGQAEIDALPGLLGIDRHLLSGEVTADLRLEGTALAPQMRGALHLKDGRYENAATGTLLEQMQAVIDARQDGLELTQFSASDGGTGAIEATGALALDRSAGFPFTMDAKLRQARLVRRDDLRTTASGGLRAEGTLEDVLVSGELTMSPVRVRLPERLPARSLQTIPVQEVGERPGEAPETDSGGLEAGFIFPEAAAEPPDPNAPGQSIRLDIQADFPRDVSVTGNGLDSAWRGKLHITGTQAAPRLSGTLSVDRGTLNFLGRHFNLETSTLTFNENTPPSPFLNILAAAQTRDVEARLRLTGSFHALNVSMESTPALPQDEVLSYVLFGKNLTEIGPGQAVQLARYATMFSGRQSGLDLLSGPQGLPGLDKIDIRQGPELADTTVGVRQQLGERVYVELEQGIGPQSGRARVEIELTDDISVEGQAGADNRSRIGVYWKRDY